MDVQLSSNGVSIPPSKQYFYGLREYQEPLNDIDRLRSQYDKEGYVFLKNYLETDQVLALREEYFSQIESEMLMPGSNVRDGIFSGHVPAVYPEYGVKGHPAYNIVRGKNFNRFTNQKKLYSVCEKIVGRPVVQLRRRPVRQFYKGQKMASRAHIDMTYLPNGCDEVVTIWIPLGQCPLSSGGLVYLEKSHQIDIERIRPMLAGVTDRLNDNRPITHDLRALSELTNKKWLWADFEPGDIVVHSPYIVHASLDCNYEVMRLSTDVRFVPEDSNPDPAWLNDWSADDGF